MLQRDPADLYMARLRQWRTRSSPDLSLAFMKPMFKQQVERPYARLHQIAALWQQLVPAELVGHTRLDRLSYGVLHVSVESSTHLYELDRLLRSGLQRQLIVQHKGPALRRVQLRVAAIDRPPPDVEPMPRQT